ncbi:MAG TPA: TetR/AcrR family transcriptional regulator [Dehalococcoidia bacterium]
MPKLKPEELEARRVEIIEAARACFLRSGFHQTTTDEICREASITPGGLYHYFDSKDELIAAVIARSAENATQRMRSLIEDADDAESAFRLVAGFFFETMRDADIDNVTRLEIEIWAEALKNDKLASSGRSAWQLRQDWLEALVQRGVDDGVYDAEVVEPKAMASLLLAIYLGLRVGQLLGGKTFDTQGAIRSLFLMHAGRLTADIPEYRVPAAK